MIRKQCYHIADKFEKAVYSKGIKNYLDLLQVIRNGSFHEFKTLYYKQMSQEQELIMKMGENIKFEYKKYDPQNQNEDKEFYILVVGTKGSGKTTFINSLCNAIIIENKNYLQSGVRYYLQDEIDIRESETIAIQRYSIFVNNHNKSCKINIIDTPGDEVFDLDEKIVQLGNKAPHLDLILLVSKEQERTFEEAQTLQKLSIVFGIDTPKYTKVILTFSKLQIPIKLDFNDFHEKQLEPKYYQFQNSLMFISGEVKFQDTLLIQRNLDNFNNLMQYLFNKPNNEYLNLSLTLKVIELRRQIHELKFKARMTIKKLGIIVISIMEQEYCVKMSSNFEYKKQIVEKYEYECKKGFMTAYCSKCASTCYQKCNLMSIVQYIVIQNNRCISRNCGHSINDHELRSKITNYVIQEKTFEYAEVKQQYQEGERRLAELKQEQAKLRDELCIFFASVKIKDQELKQLALSHDVNNEAGEYYSNIVENALWQQNQCSREEIKIVDQLYKSREQIYTQMAFQQLEGIEGN